MTLLKHPVETAAIPYLNTHLKGYHFAPDTSGEARPTLLLPCGYDSTAESGWSAVPGAIQRGYNAFILVGRSFAGYLAPRTATAEHRIAALVCDPAQPDLAARLPTGWASRLVGPIAALQMRPKSNRAEFVGSRMAAHGITQVADYIDEMRRYTMLDKASQITCPTLVIECEGDFAGGGDQALVDAVSGPTTLIQLTADSSAGGHGGGVERVWEAAVHDWINRIISKEAITRPACRRETATGAAGATMARGPSSPH